MRDRITKYVKWILPALFILYYGNISLFIHTHIVDGVIIVHSHPFKNNPDGSPHDHNSNLAEIQFYNSASTIHALDGAVASLVPDFFERLYAEILLPATDSVVKVVVEGSFFLRPPPISSII